jgi:cbb3-type cytochrome oxidase maturation protein
VEILYLLVPIAAVIATVIAVFFVWSIKSGQYEDMEGPAHRILMDDDDDMIPEDARVKEKDRT